MPINLRIENFVLSGLQLSSTDQAELVASLQRELGRLLSMDGKPQPWETLHGLDHIQAGEIRYQSGGSPTRLGREIAASLHSSLQANLTEQ